MHQVQPTAPPRQAAAESFADDLLAAWAGLSRLRADRPEVTPRPKALIGSIGSMPPKSAPDR